MSSKIINIGNHTLELKEYETAISERSKYGLNVYMVRKIDCTLWEYLMSSDTIREKAYRDVPHLWTDFIRGDKESLLNLFLSRLYNTTGLNFHILTKKTMPSSIYERLAARGFSFSNAVGLIVYGNNE